MGIPKEKEGYFTYADYLSWPEDGRWEIINGTAYDMSPAPNRQHQTILGLLYRKIADITDHGSCETFLSPFDIRLPATSGADRGLQDGAQDELAVTVVQPDISVFCRQNVLDDRGAFGAPDIAVEILSPATSHKDQTQKLELYERHGVREYWIVNGESGYVMIYRLEENGHFAKPDYYHKDDSLFSRVLGDVEIPLRDFVIRKQKN